MGNALGNQNISVKYIYSACIVTSTPDVRILHDPWFTEGAYDGAWFHYPQVRDPLTSIGNVDLIYVSHIHPDHCDEEFLRKYFSRYGKKEILVANHVPNYLGDKLKRAGMAHTVLESERTIGNTAIEIVPHRTGSVSDLDSAIVVKYKTPRRTHCVLNANDIICDERIARTLKDKAGDVDILLCGYTGAGPYPQTYFDVTDPALVVAADRKKLEFFDRYRDMTRMIQAKVNIPFAGKYLLGGILSHLNPYRGVADAVEVLDFDKHAVVLADDGGEIDTESLRSSAVRKQRYSPVDVDNRIREIAMKKMDYEDLIPPHKIRQLPLRRLLGVANRNALRKSECSEDHFFCIKLPDSAWAVINAKRTNDAEGRAVSFLRDAALLPSPRSEMTIDPRYLFGLLTGIYHWNNAEIGSHNQVRRYPDVFNRNAQNFLNYFCV